ncbi:hypothetical protein, conserved [Plasmodium gonderi]|uniref:Uncharacterized protein n=1 Tax=Plasmodium gonderi TaxID=77519 RepID=A0A1Y1JG20_PLAGO|nr:hypothetical protein, conserved [Plasmodium gonderi]GAW79702.1 hypothetical protein, conserved [Plasmodium gonderi]
MEEKALQTHITILFYLLVLFYLKNFTFSFMDMPRKLYKYIKFYYSFLIILTIVGFFSRLIALIRLFIIQQVHRIINGIFLKNKTSNIKCIKRGERHRKITRSATRPPWHDLLIGDICERNTYHDIVEMPYGISSDISVNSDGAVNSDCALSSDGAVSSDGALSSDGAVSSDGALSSDGAVSSDSGVCSDGVASRVMRCESARSDFRSRSSRCLRKIFRFIRIIRSKKRKKVDSDWNANLKSGESTQADGDTEKKIKFEVNCKKLGVESLAWDPKTVASTAASVTSTTSSATASNTNGSRFNRVNGSVREKSTSRKEHNSFEGSSSSTSDNVTTGEGMMKHINNYKNNNNKEIEGKGEEDSDMCLQNYLKKQKSFRLYALLTDIISNTKNYSITDDTSEIDVQKKAHKYDHFKQDLNYSHENIHHNVSMGINNSTCALSEKIKPKSILKKSTLISKGDTEKRKSDKRLRFNSVVETYYVEKYSDEDLDAHSIQVLDDKRSDLYKVLEEYSITNSDIFSYYNMRYNLNEVFNDIINSVCDYKNKIVKKF